MARWLVLTLLCAAQAQAPDVRSYALQHAHSYAWLQELSDTIGPRLTGSPQEAQAGAWAMRKMESIGLRNVHLERWPLQKGWQRGPAQAELTAPFHLPLQIASYGWTGSTPGSGVEADLVLVNRDAAAEELRHAASWAGKIVFLASRGPKRGAFSDLALLVSAAQKAHAAAVIARDARPGVLLTHTGPVSFGTEAAYSIAVVDIAAEQQTLIERLLTSGMPARMRIVVENRFSSGPVESANVIGEIPGTEHPEQVVILGAHLDSWDLGTGSLDDGYGVATVLGAAESIAASGLKPRRTIRVVLFTGEEQGLLGSRAWVRAHASEIPNVVCTLVMDWGQGAIQKIVLAGHDEFAAPLKTFQTADVSDGYLTYTDAYSFTLVGVPGLAFAQAYGDYGMLVHSAADTLDKVDAATMAGNTAVVSLTAFRIADHPSRLGSVWPADKTAQKLTEDGQRPALEMFGLWPFGR